MNSEFGANHDSEYDQEHEEGSSVVSPSMSQEIRDVMDKLFTILPSKFILGGQGTTVGQLILLLDKFSPLLMIKPIL